MQQLIIALALAMARVEGWFNPGTRSRRNNNPGNMRFERWLMQPGYVEDKAVGQDGSGFAIWGTAADGMDAFQRQLAIWYREHTQATILDICTLQLGQTIGHPAITDQGDPFAYAATVAEELRESALTPLTTAALQMTQHSPAAVGTDTQG
jgi:hypothetical protein